MKYAVHYYKSFRYFNQVDEIVFDYKGTEYLTEFIPNLLKLKQRAIINISQLDIEEIFEYLLILKQRHENFVVQLNWFNQLDWIPALEEMQIKYMFINFATNIEQVYAFSQYNITDIYICEGLGFRLNELQNLRNKGISLRVFPDVAQSNRQYAVPAINRFFIRPEGLDVYEDYIDTIELWHCDNRLSVVYEIYKQRHWNGYLEDLILDLEDISLNNNTLLPLFDTIRVKCGRGCLIDNSCHYCFRNLELAPLLEKNNLLITRKRDPFLTKEEQQELDNYLKELQRNPDEQGIIENNMQFEN